MAYFARNIFIFFIFIFVLGTLFIFWRAEHKTALPTQSYTDFLENLHRDRVAAVEIRGNTLMVTSNDGRLYTTIAPDISSLVPKLESKRIRVTVSRDNTQLIWFTVLFAVALTVVLLVWAANLKRQEKNAEDEPFASEKMIRFTKENRVTFDDVAGISSAKEELVEVIEFLKNPEPFKAVGATIPRGILLQGPPGTGKTLLAKAIAGEAGVPFFSFSGSDFVEMFVGVGASRVRDLFREAKKNAPCIVFIDEIDAVGGSRAASGVAGGTDERAQTLNALLVEMDGFGTDDTVLVLAATNRPDILDPALLRPGRFDRQITILPPDVKGRKKILEVHTRKVKLGPDINLKLIAQTTPGFTGAELHNLVNEAALLAARKRRQYITMEDFDEARDRILLGVERKGMVFSEKDRKILAFHEAGHAIVAKRLPEADPLVKITIIPRGRALGQTQQLPLNDRHAYSREYLLDKITIFMGGRAAEEIIFGQRSTGAQDDLLQSTEIATSMICKWGMANTLAPRAYVREGGGFLGDPMTMLLHSDEAERQIDQEINDILQQCYQKARDILTENRDYLNQVAEVLLKEETLDNEELDIIFECTTQKAREEKNKACQI
ncbi:ATP-dependent zinc metalloprotease FtsH [Desulfolithobacter dissulfuricans]|uniref:ATP-dependent zinc metalloprotease FtsH n=1 Tax=Desulfolithobacter dissulfuricans TaxID=2795293 RepID=A0A915UAI7_9BACT|nr:ATP-dependent zinc metalloprotease FtsH [Desulfolithobacter dissulfuricans]BCO09605.1 ATP-dependent zinc metalloprotease FtsH [Desulfolithobacter dissulfuricans]